MLSKSVLEAKPVLRRFKRFNENSFGGIQIHNESIMRLVGRWLPSQKFIRALEYDGSMS